MFKNAFGDVVSSADREVGMKGVSKWTLETVLKKCRYCSDIQELEEKLRSVIGKMEASASYGFAVAMIDLSNPEMHQNYVETLEQFARLEADEIADAKRAAEQALGCE